MLGRRLEDAELEADLGVLLYLELRPLIGEAAVGPRRGSARRTSCRIHAASRTLSTNQPSPWGTESCGSLGGPLGQARSVLARRGSNLPRCVLYPAYPEGGDAEEVSTLRKLSTRKLIACAFAGIVLGVGVPFAGADAGGRPRQQPRLS